MTEGLKKLGPRGILGQISRLVIVERDLYGRCFGKSWRSLEFLTKCRVLKRCQRSFLKINFGGSGISAQVFRL